jgi:hypothetical protein
MHGGLAKGFPVKLPFHAQAHNPANPFFHFCLATPLCGLHGFIPDTTALLHLDSYLVTSLIGREKIALEAKV